MRNISVEQIVAIHSRFMAGETGDSRILSLANLHQVVFSANLIPECLPRAAFIFYSLCAYPAFREGNPGTALAVTADVLASGRYQITGERAELMNLAKEIADFSKDIADIEAWLAENTLRTE